VQSKKAIVKVVLFIAILFWNRDVSNGRNRLLEDVGAMVNEVRRLTGYKRPTRDAVSELFALDFLAGISRREAGGERVQ